MAVERTFAMLKPGVLPRRLVGEVIIRIEQKGFHIISMKMITMSRELAETHYKEHRGKPFFESLIEYMISGPVITMVLERENAIPALRKLAGATDPDMADPGTIRGDLGVVTGKNLIHASDSAESADREIQLFFTEEDINVWEDGNGPWL
jgi:nucleoside-diphosphate kinase